MRFFGPLPVCVVILIPGCPEAGDSPGADSMPPVSVATDAPGRDPSGDSSAPGRARVPSAVGDSFDVKAVLVGAGDIGRCSSTGHDETATLLDAIEGTVFTLGDNAYPDGSALQFDQCYARSWGRHRARTRPTPGNHDYRTREAAGYFAYFGDAAGPVGKGYYAYELGGWQVLALNSVTGLHEWSSQTAWIRRTLAASGAGCTIAYWHESRFSSGEHGNNSALATVWKVLYEHGVDVIVTAHDHFYERFAPQSPDGTADPQRGIRAFIVGTGGAGLRPIGIVRANSEFRDAWRFGVLRLELGEGSYRWSFVAAPDGSVTDTGIGVCH